MLATCSPNSITSVATSALILGQLVTGHFINVHHILGLSLESDHFLCNRDQRHRRYMGHQHNQPDVALRIGPCNSTWNRLHHLPGPLLLLV
jgi:hypothetical protein